MKKRIMGIVLCVLGGIVCIGVILILYLIVISTGKIEPYLDNEGKILENSISEKFVIEINGAKNGFFIKGKDIDNPVILFVSSGPGTEDYFFNETYPEMNLSDYFTVCYWSYRGMGLAYDKNINPEEITTKVLLEDTYQVTEYLKKRFNKDKIYILGFSGGTNIALQAIKNHPEQYEAYFGMSQVISHGSENDTLIYNFIKNTFAYRNDTTRLNKLEKIVTHQEDGTVISNNWYEFVCLLHEAGGGTIKDKTEMESISMPIIMAHCYTLTEKINYIKGMKMYRKTIFSKECESIDYRELIHKVEVPVYFISGEYDYNCPWPLVEEYASVLEAPSVEFVKVKDSAHSPLWENSGAVVEYIKKLAK